MAGFGDHKKSQKKIKKKLKNNYFKEQIIKNAFNFNKEGNISEAIKYYKSFINKGFEDERVFSNYGLLLIRLGKLKEAEFFTRKALQLNPNYAIAHSNLGGILKELGKLKEAELSTRKALQLDPNIANANMNLGGIFKELGKLKEAELSTRKAIELNPKIVNAHKNLGGILKDLGKLKEAELFTRKAIELDPNLADTYSNLGLILRDLGKLKEAEISILKAIELNPNLALAYFNISTLKYSNKNKKWQETLFSKNFLNNKSKKDQVNVYFARANILHNEKKYQESSRYLKLANEFKLDIKKSHSDFLINKSKSLLIETDKKSINQKKIKQYPQSIFIVGMPRSGSTLVESILSMNSEVFDLGEINILEESFLQQKNIDQEFTLTDIYWNKISKYTENFYITTNKWLYNYQYAGIISREIKNAKIIHCFRNPLDNILSIYRANFTKHYEFCSSLRDCTKIYLDQEQIMSNYKDRFRSKIYDLNYDSLVSNPNKEIKSLISWLDWQWEDSYLSPHLNKRSVLTASSVEVRSPINVKSIGGWKNYRDMLQPSMEILNQTERYRNLLL